MAISRFRFYMIFHVNIRHFCSFLVLYWILAGVSSSPAQTTTSLLTEPSSLNKRELAKEGLQKRDIATREEVM